MSQIKIKQVEGLQTVINTFNTYMESGSLKSTYTQPGHGFKAGIAICFQNGSWKYADASSAAKLGRLVIESVTANTFVAVQIGLISIPGWNLTPEKYYVVNEAASFMGEGVTNIEQHDDAATPNFTYSNPVLQALTATTAHVLPWRPSFGSAANGQGEEYTQTSASVATPLNSNYTTTGITLDYNPFDNAEVLVTISGIPMTVSYGNRLGEVYFSNDGGLTAKAVSTLAAGDTLYYNGLVTGYAIGTQGFQSLVTLVYPVSFLAITNNVNITSRIIAMSIAMA